MLGSRDLFSTGSMVEFGDQYQSSYHRAVIALGAHLGHEIRQTMVSAYLDAFYDPANSDGSLIPLTAGQIGGQERVTWNQLWLENSWPIFQSALLQTPEFNFDKIIALLDCERSSALDRIEQQSSPRLQFDQTTWTVIVDGAAYSDLNHP